jgi:stage II sporulation protein P
MNINNKQKIFDKPLKTAANSFFFLILSAIAILIGIQLGNLLYRFDLNVINKIDTQNFKKVMNFSLPIMETVYNSGKSSVSFSSEIKGLLVGLFGFDLESPATIFNAQSPIFTKYYRLLNINKSGSDGQLPSDETPQATDGSGRTPSGQNGQTADDSGHNGNGPGTGQDPGQDNGSGLGTGPNNSDGGKNSDLPGGAGGSGNKDSSDGMTGKETGEGSPESSISTDDGAGCGYGWPGMGIVGQGSALQSISSISWEVEDEDEDDKAETVELEKIAIRNNSKFKIDVAKLLKEPLKIDMSKKGPKVLVYHTHTSESYVLKEADLGKKDTASFNSNPKYNVVRVGEELTRHLKKYGIATLHNGTVHDKVRDAAYGVSIDTLQSYKKSYPSIQVYIDVHRDAVAEDKPKLRMTTEINGKSCAQIMFVVGTDGTLPHPKWQENLKFVLKLQQKLNEKYPGLAKPILIKPKRYNQHISSQSILIEVGGDGNLLSECLETAKYLAEVLHDVLEENS